MIRDIEDAVNDIIDILKEKVPIYASYLDIEKGDTLLAGYPINGEAYYKWYLEDYPEYSASLILSVGGDPYVNSSPMFETAITYDVYLSVLISDSGKRDAHIAKTRYNRVIRDVLLKEVFPVITEASFQYADVVDGVDEAPNGKVYEVSMTKFRITLGGA